MVHGTPRRPVDPLLLLEVLLILLLLGLALALFLIPTADGTLSPAWWETSLLATLFFGVVSLHWWRRRRAG